MARPSGSRTVGPARISTGKFRSRTMRRMTRNCWPSFSPNTAMSGSTMLNSLATTVATPRKWPGRVAPHRPRDNDLLDDVDAVIRRVHASVDFRVKNDVGARLPAQRLVALEIARVCRQVLVRPELGGIDEEADHDDVAVRARQSGSGRVSLVQISHGRHQPDAPALPAQSERGLLHLAGSAKDLHGGRFSTRVRGPGRRRLRLPACTASEPGRSRRRVPRSV